MIRRVAAWALSAAAVAIATAAVTPAALPLIDALSAALPIVPVLAGAAILAGGRAWSSALALMALLVSGLIILREVSSGDVGAVGGPSMVVVSHNVGHANVDPRGTIAALASSGADVLLLQETDGTIAPYLASLRRTYPYANACRRGCSMAIFSRWPLARVRWRFHDATGAAFGPALYTTTVRLPWRQTATLATLHLSRSLPAAERAAQRSSLASAVRRAGAGSMILAGDFNLSPWGAAMRRLDGAMRPMRRATRAIFSFPARWRGRTAPLPLVPIDHLYAGPHWTIVSARRLPRTGSDHYPIRTKLLWRQRGL